MAKRILVCAYFAKNMGDDLFLKVLIDRYPNVRWDLLTANRHYLKIFKNYKQVRIIYTYRDIKLGKQSHNLFFLINNLFKYKKYDAMINIGGSIFMQNPAWKIRLEERKYILNQIKAEKNFIIGANFGPFKDDQFIKAYQELLPHYDDVCFRDEYSYNLFKDLKNVRLAPDVVFNYEYPKCKQSAKIIGFSTINLQERVGLQAFSNSYHHKVIELIKQYIARGYHIRLFSFCENEGDLRGIKQMMKQIHPLNHKQIKVINYTGDIDSFINAFQSCEQIIGSRLHALILAMLFNKSFYPLYYSDKTKHILEDFKINHIGTPIKEIDQLKIEETIKIAETNRLVDRQRLLRANDQFQKIDEFILGRRIKSEEAALICD